VDLVEEVARVVGMSRISGKTHARFVPASHSDRRYDLAMRLRRACVAQGVYEARSLTLVPAQPLGGVFTGVPATDWIRVKNPMIDDQVVLRPNLLHGLLKAVNIQSGAVRLFEVGRVFRTASVEESTHLALVLCGSASERTWRSPVGSDSDLYEIKGIVSAVLGGNLEFVPVEEPALALCLQIRSGQQVLGRIGQLWPADERSLDARAPVVFGEVDLEVVSALDTRDAAPKYREIPRYPSVTRDIALVGEVGVRHADVERVIRGLGEPLLVGVELFDVYRDQTGVKLPADRKSLAYSLTYRSLERTLTAEEVNAAHGRLREALMNQLGLGVRE
jgi:phenylalanyl-tRNA synthetase beta chain